VKPFIVAIDGPAGAGKSTVARLTAEKVGFMYIDTGAMYRAVGLHFLQDGIDTKACDDATISEAIKPLRIVLTQKGNEQRVLLNGEDVTTAIRTPEASKDASLVSALPAVRDFVDLMTRQLTQNSAESGFVIEGRDTGTTIFPHAQLKIYLDAAPEIRATRRFDELLARGADPDYESVLKDVIDRDFRDMHRAVSPLRKADDAVLVDCGGIGIFEVVDAVTKLIKNCRSVNV